MLSVMEYVKQSLDLHLFFLRIMKEHSLFLEAGFTPKNATQAQQADNFKTHFDQLLADAVVLSNGVASAEVINSGEVFTPYTLNAEMATQYFTGIPIQTEITRAEAGLAGNSGSLPAAVLEKNVQTLNQRAIDRVSALIQFKTVLLSDVLSCKIFTLNYPLLIDHILREAKLYLRMIQKLQSREEIDTDRYALEQERFWNQIMAEHAKFIRGLLDPTEDTLILTANNFGNEFDKLTAEAKAATDTTLAVKRVTDDSIKATRRIRDFKEQGTQGLLGCKIKSIILPLLGDHVLREANHYLRLLKKYEQ